MPGRGRPKKSDDHSKVKNPGMAGGAGPSHALASDSSSDEDSVHLQDSFDNVMQDEAPVLGRELEQGELASDSGSEGDIGAAAGIDAMVKKLKSTQQRMENRIKQLVAQADRDPDEYKWKKEGLRIQHELGVKVLAKCSAISTALANQQYELAKEYLQAVMKRIRNRNKELRIADESEGGWETVAAYRSHPVADNAEDDKAIRRAEKVGKERLAAKQRKSKLYSRNRYYRPFRNNYRDDSYTDNKDYYRSVGSNRSQDANQRQAYVPERRRPNPQSVCFYCGQQGHWQSNCPTKSAKKD